MALLFDLDGTLLDSTADLAAATNAARRHLDLAPLPVAEIGLHIGWGLSHLLHHTLPSAQHGSLPACREVFMAHYAAHLVDHSRPYPGVTAFLARQPERSLGLVTNKPGRFVGAIVRAMGWTDAFGAVIAGDTLPTRKPHPGPLLAALEQLDAEPDRSMMVGDSEVDREAAARAGVEFVAVGWGRVAPTTPRVVEDLATWTP